jgi:hypothetical protein
MPNRGDHVEDVKNLDYLSGQYKTAINSCDERTKKLIYSYLYKNNEILFLGLDDCNSPIEKMMLIALESYRNKFINLFDGLVNLTPQEEVECDGKIYRIDIVLSFIMMSNKEICIAIECDGHEFHEKTKKQVAFDKKRERDLIKSGYTVLRFSGSEIWKDPYKCAEQVFDYASSIANK